MSDFIYLLPWDKITSISKHFDIDRILLGSIILTESFGEDSITRYEQHYKYLYDPKSFAKRLRTTETTEIIHQRTSWGLCQIMGALARELGFDRHLPNLIDPEINLLYACRHLKNLFVNYKDQKKVISAYNAGSPIVSNGVFQNQKYVDKVLWYISEIQ